MARNGFKVFDSDMHIMEPPDLWEHYSDPEFRDRAPRGRTSENVRDLGTIFPKVPVDTRRTGGTPHHGRNFTKNQDLYRSHAERGWSGEVQLEAMDTEGIDMAVLFPTRGLGILTFPDQDPRFAAAMARAYNDWLHDFCKADPNRLLGAGMISVYNLDDALSETRRVAFDPEDELRADQDRSQGQLDAALESTFLAALFVEGKRTREIRIGDVATIRPPRKRANDACRTG